MGKIRESFGQAPPDAAQLQSPTVEAVAQVRADPAGEEVRTPVVEIQPHGKALSVFGLPGRGTNVPSCHANDGDGRCHTELREEAAVKRRLPEIRLVQPRGPSRLARDSWGGKNTFAGAQALAKEGKRLSLLALFDSTPPAMTEPIGVGWDEATAVKESLLGLEPRHGLDVKALPDQIAAVTCEERFGGCAVSWIKPTGSPPGRTWPVCEGW